MLRTNSVFRFRSTDSARCIMTFGPEPTFPVPEHYVFNAEREPLSRVHILRDLEDVTRLYKRRVRAQLLLWVVLVFGVVVTVFAVLSIGWLAAIPYLAICGYFGNYILCWPDGTMYDPEHNVLYSTGELLLSSLEDAHVFVKGTNKYW